MTGVMIGENSGPSAQERRLSLLEREVAQIQTSMGNLSTQIEGISRQITKLADTQAAGQRTPWTVIFSGASVLLAIIFSIGGLVTDGLGRQDKLLDRRLSAIEVLALDRAGILAAQNERIAGIEGRLDARVEVQQDLRARVNAIESSRYTPAQAQQDLDNLQRLLEAKIGDQ